MKNRIKLNITNLKKSIIKKRITKTDLALQIGVTRETFSRWLSGKVEYIDENKLLKLSELLDCEMSWLSPEIPPSYKRNQPATNPFEQIRGDDFIRMGLYSGLWRGVSNLYAASQYADIVEDGEANLKLCQTMQALMSLDFSQHEIWSEQPADLQKNHELFDVIARYNLIAGISLLFSGQIDAGHRMFKRVIIQGRSEWLVSFAYLLSGFCYVMASSPKEAFETWNRGLMNFPNSQNDLTIFVQANLRLALCSLAFDGEHAQGELQKARRLFDSIGYRFGYARCLSYEALLLALQNKKEESLLRVQEASSFLHHLPRLYQLEAFLLHGRMHMTHNNQEGALHSMEMAHDLTQEHEVLASFVKNHLNNLVLRKVL